AAADPIMDAPAHDAAAADRIMDAPAHDAAAADPIMDAPPASAAPDLLMDAAALDAADADLIMDAPPASAAPDLRMDAVAHDAADADPIMRALPASAAHDLLTDAAAHDAADGAFAVSMPIRIRPDASPEPSVSLMTGDVRLSPDDLRDRMLDIMARMVRSYRDEWEAWLVALMAPVRRPLATIGVAVVSAFSGRLVDQIESSPFRSVIASMTWEPRWGTQGMDVLRLSFDAHALQQFDDRSPRQNGKPFRSDVWLPIGVSRRPPMMVYYPFGLRRTLAVTTPTWSHQLLQRMTTAWVMTSSLSIAVYNPANIPLTLMLPGEASRRLCPVSRSDLLSLAHRAFLIIRADVRDDHDLHSILVQRPDRVMIIDSKDGGTAKPLYRSLGWLALSGDHEGTAHIIGTTVHVCVHPLAEGMRSNG
ncbi:MAG: hypothetical protein ACPL89_23280, partial [Roseiflexus castenholzii]